MAGMEVCTQIIKDLVDLCSGGLTFSSKAMLPPGCSQPVNKHYMETGMRVSPACPMGDSSKIHLYSGTPSSWLRLSQNCATVRIPIYPILTSVLSQVSILHCDLKSLLVYSCSPPLNLHKHFPPMKPLYILSHVGCFSESLN